MASTVETDEPPLIEDLRRQLAESQAETMTLRAALSERALSDSADRSTRSPSRTPAETQRRSPKQPDPPLLSDGKELTFTSWSILIRAKLRDNDDHFPSEDSKLTYVYGRTTGAAQAHLEPRFEYSAPNPFTTVDEVMAHLAAIYQNPMRQAIAQDQYYDLRQGRTEDFSEFLTKFQHLAGLGAISSTNWRQDLYRKLNVLYQENLVPTLPLHDTYEKLVVQCQHLEHVLIPLLARKAAERTSRRVSPAPKTIRQSVNPSPPAPVTSSALALPPCKRPTPAPLAWRPPTARDATPAPEQSNITCYNCGKTGHKIVACPEPCKPGEIHEIDENGQGSDSTDITDEDSGKEDP